MRRKSYTAETKLEAVKFARKFGTNAAAIEFEVAEQMINRWKQAEPALMTSPKNKRAFRGLRAKWPDVEKDLKAWVLERRSKQRAVNGPAMKREAIKIATKLGIRPFSPSNSWIQNFMRRNGLSMRRRTSVGQPLPKDCQSKKSSFRSFCREFYDVSPNNFGNLDEVPVPFDIVSNRTVEVKGKDDISIASTGNEKTNFTVVLGILADGSKLPPMLIFKRKTLPKGNFPGVIIKANPTGWMNSDLMKEWIDEIWLRRANPAVKSEESVLVLDSARCHLTDNVKAEIQQHSKLAVIPGGLTRFLQPLDISVNKPFKDNLKAHWEEWMSDSRNDQFTLSGRKKRASYETVAEWVRKSFDAVPSSCIINGFRRALTDETVLKLSTEFFFMSL